MEGVLGPGLSSICINYVDALVACSVADNLEMMSFCGNNSTISECLYYLVLGA